MKLTAVDNFDFEHPGTSAAASNAGPLHRLE
jgi:hypothetical protein